MTKSELMKHPYIRIKMAFFTGKGVVLSADEVQAMWLDDAIMTHADYVAEQEGYRFGNGKLYKIHEEN